MVSAPTISVYGGRLGRALRLAPLLLVLAACSGPERAAESVEPPPDPDLTAIAGQCLALLREYGEVDMTTASEAELQRQMDEALLNKDLCGEAFREAYRGQGGEAMAGHLARMLEVHALQAELSLSTRFDEMAGYCEILRELLELLDADLAELHAALTDSPPPDETDVQALLPLYQLTLQTAEVSLLDYDQTCQ